MENKRALFLIENSNLSDHDKEFLLTHLNVYEDMLGTVTTELTFKKEMLAGIKKDLEEFNVSRKQLVNQFNIAWKQTEQVKSVLDELQKVNEELKLIKEGLDSSAKQSIAKSYEQIYYIEYKLRKAVESINMIDFSKIRQTV